MNKPKLLLHACCAPCLTSVFEQLKEEFDVTIFWFNTNIYPQKEYAKRLIEVERYAKIIHAEVINKKNYEIESFSWAQLVKNYAEDAEGGKRCELCIKYRLLSTAKYASENKYDFFSTTLSVSPHKDTEMTNKIGKKIEDNLKTNCHPELDSGSSENSSGFQIKSGMTANEHVHAKSPIKFLDRDFKENNGYKRSIDICKEFNIYRQNYCGCQYSLRKDAE